MWRNLLAVWAGVVAVCLVSFDLIMTSSPGGSAGEPAETPGQLRAWARDGNSLGQCPLERTDVRGEVSGGLSRVSVTQRFGNPFRDPVEAVYAFPLPQNAAVDRMTMRVGGRTIEGRIARREEARAIYAAARNAGQTASLLDQERPNIFTQSIANIPPGTSVEVTISYAEPLKYADGAYQFVFPMMVGPRYSPVGVDASKVVPSTAALPNRSGHDVSLELRIDAGLPIKGIHSELHAIDVESGTMLVEGALEISAFDPHEVMGCDVTVEIEMARGRKEQFTGRLVYVSSMVRLDGRYIVRAEVANRQEYGRWLLRDGMTAKMTIRLNTAAGGGAVDVSRNP